jgi:D-lactate dehydrogenase (cytochrome)
LKAKIAISLGGTCTGEHGVGSGKKALMAKEMGDGSMSVMRKIKDALDPHEILNPDKILDSVKYK